MNLSESHSLFNAFSFPVFRREGNAVEAVNEQAAGLLDWIQQNAGKDLQPDQGLLAGASTIELDGQEYLIPGQKPEARSLERCQASFGRHMGGIVHNLNNPLNALSGMVQLMMFRNPESKEFEQLDTQIDDLAALIRQLGDRFRRLEEIESGMPLSWELVVNEELGFFRAEPALKHRTLLETDLPADQLCALGFREACLLLDQMIESTLALVPREGQVPLKVDMHDGWPRFQLSQPNADQAEEALMLLQPQLCREILAPHKRTVEWHLTGDRLTISCIPT